MDQDDAITHNAKQARLNPVTIAKIDRLMGKPLCALLTLARRVVGYVRPASQPPAIRKILFIKMIEQGATVLAYRSLLRAVELVGRENVYFWVFAENRAILDLMDVIPAENVLEIRSKSLWSFASDVIRTLFRIRKIGIDATVDMEFFARAPAILAFLTGAKRRAGLHRFSSEGPYRGDLLTHRVQYNPYLHTAVAYYQLVESLNADPEERPLLKRNLSHIDARPPRFVARPDELGSMRQLIGVQDGRRIVLLNPNASDLLPLRKWPIERFIELGKKILDEHDDVMVVITGAESERVVAEQLVREIADDRVKSLAGHTTLRQLLVLYCIADALVTLKDGNLNELPKRTEALHGLLDLAVGLN